jgi:HAD superfamily hydrolase (TIGR01549 family)
MKKTIIFDFGGTLDTNGIHWSFMFADTYKKIGLNIPKEIFNKAYVKADEELKKMVKENINTYDDLLIKQTELQLKNIDLKEQENIAAISENISGIILKEMKRCVNDSKKILGELKAKYRLGLVSNFYGNLDKVCDSIGISEFFDVMIDSEKEGIEKPHPGIFSLALLKLNANPEDTFVVGDSYERDIVPAKILGCKTIWLKKKSFKENSNTDSADYIVGDIKDIMKYLS